MATFYILDDAPKHHDPARLVAFPTPNTWDTEASDETEAKEIYLADRFNGIIKSRNASAAWLASNGKKYSKGIKIFVSGCLECELIQCEFSDNGRRLNGLYYHDLNDREHLNDMVTSLFTDLPANIREADRITSPAYHWFTDFETLSTATF